MVMTLKNGALNLVYPNLRDPLLRAELARGVGHNTYGEPAWPNDLLYMFPICIWANTLFGHNLATWTTHETAQRQEVASCTHWFIRQLVSLAHSSISASKDAHPEGLDLWALDMFRGMRRVYSGVRSCLWFSSRKPGPDGCATCPASSHWACDR